MCPFFFVLNATLMQGGKERLTLMCLYVAHFRLLDA